MKTCALLLAAALTGCAIADFTPYSGQQQNWRLAPGAFVKSYVIPAYYGFPDRPYVVLGYMDATTAPIRQSGVVEFAARRAKELGADAIIVLHHGTQYAGTISTSNAYAYGSWYGNNFSGNLYGSGFSGPVFLGKAQIVAVKWR
jgi:hypothetical protein